MLRISLRSLSLLLLIGVVFALPFRGERIEDLPKPQNYVSDFAHVLSPVTEQRLDALCAQVDHRANAQIAVVTINTLDGDDIDDYTSRLEEKWGVGKKGSDRGVILLFAIQDRKRRIEVGYGLEGILPDGRVGDIGREMVPYLRQGDYDQAISLGVKRIADVIAADANVTLNAPQPAPVHSHASGGVGSLIALLIFFVFVLLLLSRMGGGGLLGFLLGMFMGNASSGRYSRRGRGDWRDWGGGGFGGGGDGGGSGFGGFGGGSSGGGGASGDW
jgi:uncharacterized protein